MPVQVNNPPAPVINTAVFITALKPKQTGSVPMAITDTAKTVVLGSAMPNTNYVVGYESPSGIAASLGVSAKTPTSFIVMSVGVAIGGVNYIVDGL